MGRSVEDWLASEEDDEWSQMMRKVAAFHHKHDFAGNNGHDMGYRIALTVEELGELAAAVTKGKPIEECAEEMADVMILLMMMFYDSSCCCCSRSPSFTPAVRIL